MKKFRIIEVSTQNRIFYIIQQKFLFTGWTTLQYDAGEFVFYNYQDREFSSIEEAEHAINRELGITKEYYKPVRKETIIKEYP